MQGRAHASVIGVGLLFLVLAPCPSPGGGLLDVSPENWLSQKKCALH